ncbi:SulP family inorganic anion transporter [Bradyrhizobium sp. U87765 SZCCT0131]|uniref:SulP family inorganic anion transporter n=1 Tax=unclassified Bradyrhizobium TaxID=2631580 RepID=UPI001BA58781|nr:MULTISPECIES: SulP family inorganic anion transporter [unclassified Bradyrhizobium]MBR1222190.1 SulP family inorganic anion transporter [Bradyrhizobium sp. U87765 SZCCT0131]MBR1265681.1 SulP family inorganic anion transporter [Bradyrhizobium sp. U87765 SZCCT0134]MBR1307891.1 SulP family inorganic anion transporter [Bradyrhizobium sp. U87765 SZCCT0110]MBR1323999.1 SulP family inorganic anion transporter [Bradyrhizobium sp. U87765 SZCCT0109]MBR1348311.1 SulP family inorganic anion transporter
MIVYGRDTLRRDLIAGLTVAAISLPQGMAYALLAGVDPRYGLYSAILVTAVASIFGSSSHLINGPTSAISLVVFSALSMFDADQRVEAVQAMFLLGAMVGAIQIAIAVLRLGDLTRYISESVILGFMSAAAFLLAVGQVSNALGVRDKGTGAQHILYRLWLTLTAGDAINSKAVLVTAVTLVLAIGLRHLVRRYHWPQFDMLAVLLIVGVGAYLAGWTVPGSDGRTAIGVAGAIPGDLPSFHVPTVQLGWAADLASDSVAIAFLGLLEALAIAKSIAHQTRQPLDFNRQCLAEGLANLAGGFFQCLPGSGSLSRSAINFQAGAATRFSGILTAAFVAVAVIAFAPLARYVPKPALAALLLLTASRLVDVTRVVYAVRASRLDASVVAITALSAVAFGLDLAIIIGVALSILLFVPRAAKMRAVELIVDDYDVVRERLSSEASNDGFLLYDLEGELFFGAGPELERILHRIKEQAGSAHVRNILLRLKRVRNPDVVSLEHLEQFLRDARREGLSVSLAGVRPDLLAAFKRLNFAACIDSDRIFPQGADENSATLAAVRQIQSELSGQRARARARLNYRV